MIPAGRSQPLAVQTEGDPADVSGGRGGSLCRSFISQYLGNNWSQAGRGLVFLREPWRPGERRRMRRELGSAGRVVRSGSFPAHLLAVRGPHPLRDPLDVAVREELLALL